MTPIDVISESTEKNGWRQ